VARREISDVMEMLCYISCCEVNMKAVLFRKSMQPRLQLQQKVSIQLAYWNFTNRGSATPTHNEGVPLRSFVATGRALRCNGLLTVGKIRIKVQKSCTSVLELQYESNDVINFIIRY